MKATKEMLILDLLQLDPNLAELLMGQIGRASCRERV